MEAKPKAWFSSDFEIRDGDGLVTMLVCSNWKEAAKFELEGARRYTFKRQGLTGPFLLQQDDKVLARARKSAFRNRFEVEYEGQTFEVARQSVGRSDFEVREGETTVGRIRRPRLLFRDTSIQLPESWPLPLRIFVFWLVLVIWRREAAASS